MSGLVGHFTVKSAVADELTLKHADHAYTTKIVPDGSLGANCTITMPTGDSTLLSNPASGTVTVGRTTAGANSALLSVGRAAADDGGELQVHSATLDVVNFEVSDTAVTSELPVVCNDGLTGTSVESPSIIVTGDDTMFRLTIASGVLTMQSSDDDGSSWSTAIATWTAPA